MENECARYSGRYSLTAFSMERPHLEHPLVFEPLFKERIWGGRRLETLLGKRLPTSGKFGEAWEMVDRPEAQSIVRDGPLAGKTLHDLWTNERARIFGRVPDSPRFPLLIKWLAAEEKLSLQVHPPAEVAERLKRGTEDGVLVRGPGGCGCATIRWLEGENQQRGFSPRH